ncbi:MAG: hypothetical protein NTNFB01_15580 [Nitrospira sp.]
METCRVSIMRVEYGDIFLTVDIKDRDKDLSRLDDVKFYVEINRPPDIKAIHDQS